MINRTDPALTQSVGYGLFETAKLSQVDARVYVRDAALAAIESPGAVTLPSDLG
jgi:hypothetical protein